MPTVPHDPFAPVPAILRIPPREIAAIAWRRRRLLGAALLLPPALAVLGLAVLPSRYEAASSLMVKTGREYLAREEGSVNAQSAPQTTKQEDLDSEIEIMGSRPVAEAAIRRVGLATLFPAIASDPPAHQTAMDAAVEAFERHLSIKPVKLSDVIDVSYRTRSPELATATLNAFLDSYAAQHLAVFSGGSLVHVYENVVGRDLAELDRLEHQRAAIKLGAGLFDAAAQRQSLIGERADATEEWDRGTARAASLATRISYLADLARRTAPTTTATETDRSDGGAAADSALVDLERTRSELAARYAPGHPLLAEVEGQIASLQAQRPALVTPFVHVRHDPSPLLAQIEQELVVDRAELAPLAAENGRTATEISGFTAELARLERADTALRVVTSRIDTLNENLLATRAELEKARTLDGLDRARAEAVSVIQAPIASHKRVFPGTLLFAAAGLALGLLASGLALGIAVAVADGFLTADALEATLGARVLASVSGGFSGAF